MKHYSQKRANKRTTYKNIKGGADELDEYKLTIDDITYLLGGRMPVDDTSTALSPRSHVFHKIQRAAPKLRGLNLNTNEFESRNYQRVICTSDVHDDYVQLVKNLQNNNILLKNDFDFFSAEFIFNAEWNPANEKTLRGNKKAAGCN